MVATAEVLSAAARANILVPPVKQRAPSLAHTPAFSSWCPTSTIRSPLSSGNVTPVSSTVSSPCSSPVGSRRSSSDGSAHSRKRSRDRSPPCRPLGFEDEDDGGEGGVREGAASVHSQHHAAGPLLGETAAGAIGAGATGHEAKPHMRARGGGGATFPLAPCLAAVHPLGVGGWVGLVALPSLVRRLEHCAAAAELRGALAAVAGCVVCEL